MDTDRKKRLKKKKPPEKENIICVHGNWVKFSAAKNGLGKKIFSEMWDMCIRLLLACYSELQVNKANTCYVLKWPDSKAPILQPTERSD